MLPGMKEPLSQRCGTTTVATVATDVTSSVAPTVVAGVVVGTPVVVGNGLLTGGR